MVNLSLRSSLAMSKAREAESELLLSSDRPALAEASESALPAVQSHLRDMREDLASLRNILTDPRITDQVERIEAQARQYESGVLALIAQHGKEDRPGSAHEVRQSRDTAVAIESSLEALHAAAASRALQTRNDVERAAQFSRWAVIAIMAFTTLVGIVLARIINQMAASIENFNAQLESSTDTLKYQATHDAPTGLPNRALLEDRLKQAISYADRYGRLMTVVFINLDGFKAGQRQPWPQGRGRIAEVRGRTHEAVPAQRGHGRANGRRRIRDHPV
ncbi:GGDEF domain-containing protein [Variovorax paradoxus]|uniref:GGDEF domain-containing protein n=1 Tax=Variovorax paradoxus TaxID=34073 RepID=UPI0027D930CF|nr:GGDEF domain-containing protein [Variovorax paradoxus]